jgi:hypothetical protein
MLMTRYFRIAAAGFFVLLTVALIGLWVRSYWWRDTVIGPSGETHVIAWGSHHGRIAYESMKRSPSSKWAWTLNSYPTYANPGTWNWQNGTLFGAGFGLSATPEWFRASVSYWLLTGVSASLATVLASKRTWRFSVRSILIATTLLAVALGLGAYFI